MPDNDSPTPERDVPDAWNVFASAFADASNPTTFESGTEAYLVAYPNATRDSAGSAASRLLRQGRVRALIEECRQRNRTAAGLTPAEFLRRGWEVFNDLADAVQQNPKLAAAVPQMYLAVGKAGGFIVERSKAEVEVTERRLPPTPEELDQMQAGIERLRRLNTPNPLPQATATALPTGITEPAVEVDYEVLPYEPAREDGPVPGNVVEREPPDGGA